MAKLKHVDIVSNEPLASEPRLIARVSLNGGPRLGLDVTSPDTDEGRMWSYLRSVVPDIDPEAEPKTFLHALPDRIDATYLGATGVHDEAHCPFGPTSH